MENAINTLRIQNFKSIKDVTMQPRRVNLIIGPPNVGKSNILEAMSLLGGMVYDKTRRFMDDKIRYERINQIFYDNIISNIVMVESDIDVCFISPVGNIFQSLFMSVNDLAINKEAILFDSAHDFNNINNIKAFVEGFEKSLEIDALDNSGDKIINTYYLLEYFDKDGMRYKRRDNDYSHNMADIEQVYVRPYAFFKNCSVSEEYVTSYLEPSRGDNLKNIIQRYTPLRKDIAQLFLIYGLKLMLRMDSKGMEIVKDIDGIIYSYPYSSIADTLQRIIFYLAAIESNDDAVILFEEPEAHSYPQYVSMLGKRIAASRNNQFFVATHSPYLLTEILEQMLPDEEQASELAIFVAYYEDYQTKVKQLSDEEMRAIRGDSVDVFYNMNRYIPRPANG